jgi:hypothetical protein
MRPQQALRKEPEDARVALYVRLLQERHEDMAEVGSELAERSPHCGGLLTFRQLVLSPARTVARVWPREHV